MKCTSTLKEQGIFPVDIIQSAEPFQSIATTMLYLESVWIEDASKELNRPSQNAYLETTTVSIDIV